MDLSKQALILLGKKYEKLLVIIVVVLFFSIVFVFPYLKMEHERKELIRYGVVTKGYIYSKGKYARACNFILYYFDRNGVQVNGKYCMVRECVVGDSIDITYSYKNVNLNMPTERLNKR